MSFRFQAVDLANRTHSGVVEATSRVAALSDLSGQGLTVVELIAAPRSHGAAGRTQPFRLPTTVKRSPSLNEIQLLLTEWARCLDVGLTIADAVAISADGRMGTKLGRTADAVRTALHQGVPLHRAMAEHTPRLTSAALSVIEVGERSGQLASTLSHLTERLGNQGRLRSEIRSALVYPAFVVLTAFAVVAILLQAVVPAIDEIVGDHRDELAVTAQFLLQASEVYREHVIEILGGSVLIVGLFVGLNLRPATRSVLDRLWLRVPYVGSLMLANDAAQFARSLSAQIRGGVPLGQATRLSVAAFTLEPLRISAGNLERKLSEGVALSDAVSTDLPSLPRELARFARVGEQTGRLAILLEHAAEILEERARRQVRTLTSLVTPAITVGLGLLVGVIVLSLMSAIVGLNTMALR
ncbi:type II secretion system F family protein [Methylorubrum extorquens]|uniref:Type II secretion system protein n=1 Tax=Methylorubrum extorquens (strain ATCC 14718 / DSM 1338 / JCM 2805 / NCIMB 9133 / AM1) TaxID=272630 RepID=C5B3Y4_METEA|nr:type II secretion system F family protein [Methylorubrum extorquens]ACS43166.1 putative Type II secretion system protein [Methylorubrum extorquens AM1]MCP1545761.1 type II secretory pathway component PulF [Methylorubrum extorquens]MCP1591712.1 type II secretory pathway component PulF [Methylorubrum extorquens]